MKRCCFRITWITLFLWSLLLCSAYSACEPQMGLIDNVHRVFISGYIIDFHNEPVRDVVIRIWVDGKRQKICVLGKSAEEVVSEPDGAYLAEMELPEGFGPSSIVKVEISKASFRMTSLKFSGSGFAVLENNFFLQQNISIRRSMGPAFWISTAILLGVYILISFDLLHRTIAAMLGAALALTISSTLGTLNPQYHIISFETAMQKIDVNVIFLLMGMMIIVGILKKTGFFQWVAYKCFQIARGKVMILSLMLMSFTALSSALLDNVTTMLLLTPVTIEIARSLRISPLVLLIPAILAANVGGTATLIGDPPNIMIGSYAGLSFMAFLQNLAIICAINTLALFVMSKFYYGKLYANVKVEDVHVFVQKLRDKYQLTDRALLCQGFGVLVLVVFLFVTHGYGQMKVSVAALAGASILLALAVLTKKVKLVDLIDNEIEWPTLLFFLFLFIIMGCVEETGLLALIADLVLNLSKGNLTAAICLVLWVSAIVSAFVDNIPFTATMLPVAAYLSEAIPGAENNVLWWALALGACFGGNGTMLGASANVVTIGIAEREGYPISFFEFMKVGFVYMLISVGIANLWLLLFYT